MTHRAHPLWRKWTYIQYTLNNPNHKQYALAKKYNWSCDWDNFKSFAKDIEQHLGLPKPGEMLIRKDQTQGWTLKNLDYGTEKTRGNRQRTCLLLKYRNRQMTASQWAEYRGINVATLYSRLYHYNWPVAEALEYKKRA